MKDWVIFLIIAIILLTCGFSLGLFVLESWGIKALFGIGAY